METRMHFKLLFLIKMVFGNVCDNPGKNSKKTKILKSKISSGKTIWWVMYRSWNANKWRRWKCQVIIIPSNIKWKKYFMNFVTTVHVYSAISKWLFTKYNSAESFFPKMISDYSSSAPFGIGHFRYRSLSRQLKYLDWQNNFCSMQINWSLLENWNF